MRNKHGLEYSKNADLQMLAEKTKQELFILVTWSSLCSKKWQQKNFSWRFKYFKWMGYDTIWYLWRLQIQISYFVDVDLHYTGSQNRKTHFLLLLPLSSSAMSRIQKKFHSVFL